MQQQTKQLRSKLVLAGCLIAAIIIVYGYSSQPPNSAADTTGDTAEETLQSRMQGTWEAFGSRPGMRQVKLISGNHFTWVFYNRVTRRPVTMAGGTCSFTGDTYTEHIEFGGSGVQHAISGHAQVFTIRFDGDRMSKTGTLSNGMKINEMWRRLP